MTGKPGSDTWLRARAAAEDRRVTETQIEIADLKARLAIAEGALKVCSEDCWECPRSCEDDEPCAIDEAIAKLKEAPCES